MLRNIFRRDRRKIQVKSGDDDTKINMPPLLDNLNRCRMYHRSIAVLQNCLRYSTINKWIFRIFAALIVFSLLYLLYITYLSFSSKSHTDSVVQPLATTMSPTQLTSCDSVSCRNSAKFLLKALDRSVNPCNNFHEFVCGKYMISKHDLVMDGIQEKFADLMKSFDTLLQIQDSSYLTKLQLYYNSCMTNYLIYFSELKAKFEELGGWPMANKQNKQSKKKLEWKKVFHKFYQSGLTTDFLIDIRFTINARDGSKRLIVLDTPYPTKFDILTEHFDYYVVKKSWMYLAKLLNLENVKADIEEMINFEIELLKVSTEPQEEKFGTVEELQSKFPNIRWFEFLYGLSPQAEITTNDKVKYYMPHLEKFHDLMTKQNFPNHVLINYFYWQNIMDLKNDVLTKRTFMNQVIYDGIFGLDGSSEWRGEACVNKMYDDMYLAMGALFVRYNSKDENIKLAQVITQKVHHSLHQNVKKVDWLSEEAKRKVLNKISRIDALIGHPPELLNKTILDDYYRDLEVSSGRYYINNWRFQQFRRNKDAQQFAKPIDVRHWTGQFGRVAQSTATYMPQNVIIIAQGVLHELFIDEKIPNYMNYGIFGAIVGHEMSHALGDYFLHIDENNNYVNDWWDQISSEQLTAKSKCLVDKYSNYTYPKYNLRVNGKKTLDENMADITGVKAAYDAYASLMEDEPQELLFSGFKDFNNKQMFWIAYSSMYCERFNNRELVEHVIETDEHAPEQFRVNGVVSSLPEFARDFNCKPTDPMNPPEKCPIWY